MIEKKDKSFMNTVFSLGSYLFTVTFIIFIVSLVTFISYQKITKASSPKARVIIVEDEVVIEYKELKDESNID